MLQWSRKLAYLYVFTITSLSNNQTQSTLCRLVLKSTARDIHLVLFVASSDLETLYSWLNLWFSYTILNQTYHCLTKLSLRYASLNPINQSMSLNVDCHDMSSDRDFCYEYMYRHYNTFHVLFQDFLWQLRKNYRFTMTTVLCAGKGWTLQENYPVAIFFISMYYLILSTTYLSL